MNVSARPEVKLGIVEQYVQMFPAENEVNWIQYRRSINFNNRVNFLLKIR